MSLLHTRPRLQSEDRTRAALDFIHGLLESPLPGTESAEHLLVGLAQAFAASAAGLAGPLEAPPIVTHRARAGGQPGPDHGWPWEDQADLFSQVRRAPAALSRRTATGVNLLLTAVASSGGFGWLLWLEDTGPREWSAAESAALALAGQALARVMTTEAVAAGWARHLDRAQRQRRMEEAAAVTGRLAHDFGNILTGILGFAELSLTQLTPGSAPHHFVAELHQAARLGAQLINQLHQFSRRSQPRPRPTALAPLAAEEAAHLRVAWGPAIALHLAVPDDLPPVAVDPEPLRQLLGHLLANAREAIAEAGVVTLSARRTDLEELDCLDLLGNPMAGPHVELVVTDTGCGISPEARARLFLEPFFTTKPRHRGLGLAAVFGLLQSHRGGLRLGPTLEQGTAVRVFLPLAFEASRSTLGDASPSLASGEKVLVVDDDPLLLQFVCTTLQRAGYRVQGAAGADEALHSYTAAAKEPFRLVLSDVLMPRMNGFELARHLLGRDPTVNLLFISGHVPPSFPHDDLLARNFELLPKPFRPDELLRAVRTALDRGSRSLRV